MQAARVYVVDQPKAVVKQGLSEYFLFTIKGREDIKDKEPKRLVALKVADVRSASTNSPTATAASSSRSSTASRTSSCWTSRARRRSAR